MLVFQIEDNNGNVLEDIRDRETGNVRALVKNKIKNKVRSFLVNYFMHMRLNVNGSFFFGKK